MSENFSYYWSYVTLTCCRNPMQCFLLNDIIFPIGFSYVQIRLIKLIINELFFAVNSCSVFQTYGSHMVYTYLFVLYGNMGIHVYKTSYLN